MKNLHQRGGAIDLRHNELAHQPIIAAIDIGTNSCRLLVASVNMSSFIKSPFRCKPSLTHWRVLDSFGRVTRLGERLHETGELSNDAIDRTIEVLTTCRKRLDEHLLYKIRVVATEACRKATNVSVLVERAKQECDLDIEIISTEEEARLSLTGCSAVLNSNVPYAVMFDIGGGSTECIWLELDQNAKSKPGYPVPFQVLDTVSLPFGVITLSERVADLSYDQMFKVVRSSIAQALEPFMQAHRIPELCDQGEVQLIGSSGTITTLAAVRIGLQRYERRFIDGMDLAIDDLETVVTELFAMTPEARAEHPCIGPGREGLVIVGSAILRGICDAVGVTQLRVADRGVREGILTEMLEDVQMQFGQM